MIQLILIRHGQTQWNREGRWQGQADPPLNALGRRQARRAALELRGARLDHLYSSDLRRAMETAHIIGAELGLAVIPDAAAAGDQPGALAGHAFGGYSGPVSRRVSLLARHHR